MLYLSLSQQYYDTQGKRTSIHTFPKSEEDQEKWRSAIPHSIFFIQHHTSESAQITVLTKRYPICQNKSLFNCFRYVSKNETQYNVNIKDSLFATADKYKTRAKIQDFLGFPNGNSFVGHN